MPGVKRPIELRVQLDYLKRPGAVGMLIKQQFHCRGITAEGGEVYPLRIHCCARGVAEPGPNAVFSHKSILVIYTVGSSNLMGKGFTFHMSSQYSRIDRSEENLPIRATLSMDILFQWSWSR